MSRFPAPPASRMRSLLGDLARVLDLQMRFWGLDARGGEGSLLVAAGMQRLARTEKTGEGSSRYREPWEGGWVEIHSYCAGFYHPTTEGILFSRGERRIYSARPGSIAEPGWHRTWNAGQPPDTILAHAPPFVRWILDYESRVRALATDNYRLAAWRQFGGFRFGPSPAELQRWMTEFLQNPQGTPRLLAKERAAGQLVFARRDL